MKNSAPASESSTAPGFATSAVLLGVAVVGAATTGSLATVGPYLLGISVLIGALFVFDRWMR